MSEITVHYDGGLRCHAQHEESGVTVVTDAPKDNYGSGESFSPSEMLSVSLGSCILSIMAIAARTAGFDITGATAKIEKQMADSPRRIASISVEVNVPQELDEDQRCRLQAAAHACPVHNVLKIEAPITFTWGRDN
jgi:uncharacterized OsmC-like protein